MKLTPLDIHHKEFRHSLRGYAEEEVDLFLDQVADELERLFKENIDLSERLDGAQQKLNEFELQRQTINNTLVAAQRSADDITMRATSQAEATVHEAEVKAKEIIHEALAKKQAVAAELVRIKQAEEEFRARYKALLESNLRAVAEVELPSDVDVLLAQTDQGVIGDVEVHVQTPARDAVSPVRPRDTFDQEASSPEASQEDGSSRVSTMDQPTQSMPPVDQSRQGFVQSVALGEREPADVPADIALIEPGEFSLPSFDMLGEREDDVDIEEID